MGIQASIAQSKVLSGILKERFTNLKVVGVELNEFFLEFPEPKVGLNMYGENVEVVGFRILTLVHDFPDDSDLDDLPPDQVVSDLDDLPPDQDDWDSPEKIVYSIVLVDAKREDQYIEKIDCNGRKHFSNTNKVIREINRVLEFSTFS